MIIFYAAILFAVLFFVFYRQQALYYKDFNKYLDAFEYEKAHESYKIGICLCIIGLFCGVLSIIFVITSFIIL